MNDELQGVQLLRRRRGTEQVTFNDVADHLTDFAARSPTHAGAVDRLAVFLAEVEQIDHEHEEDEHGSSLQNTLDPDDSLT